MAGAIRFINQFHQPNSPFPIVPVVNYSTPVFDLYHQIPQSNNYQSFKPPSYQQFYHYPVSHQLNSSGLLGNSNLNFQPGVYHRPKPFSQRDEESNIKSHSTDGTKLIRRDGWGHGGDSGHGGGGSVSQSPAISALALLGFLFFLNLIQTSLQNNRNMLTTTTTTTFTNTSMSSSSSGSSSSGGTIQQQAGRNGRVRQRRGFGYEELRLTPESIPTHPNPQIQEFLHNKDEDTVELLLPRQRYRERGHGRQDPNIIKSQYDKPKHGINNPLTGHKNRSQTDTMLSKFKRLSVNCLHLLACKMGRTLISEIGPNAGFMMRMIGFSRNIKLTPDWIGQMTDEGRFCRRGCTLYQLRDRFLPRSNQSDWKSRVMRALSYGWRSRRNCSRIFRECSLGRIWKPQKHSRRNIRIT